MRYSQVPYSGITSSLNWGKKISVSCRVIGRGILPYLIPKKVKIKCYNKECNCGFKEWSEFIIDGNNHRVLEFIDCKTTFLKQAVRSFFMLDCKYFSVEIVETQNIERVYITALNKHEKMQYSTVVVYIIGLVVDINKQYQFFGYMTSEPINQVATCVFVECSPLATDVETFNIKNEINILNEFRVTNTPEHIYEHLIDLYDRYTSNITKIIDRPFLHMSIDLVFRSVMSFKFNNERVEKGWLDVLILGDTRTGKGYVAERLCQFFGAGEVISGESTSYAGLVCGLQQFSKSWSVTWGKIPLNDGGLLIIDEANGLRPEDWQQLSRIRSQGVAEIYKIHSQTAPARTRLIFIANPISQRVISGYSYGVQAILDIIHSVEDIARFDYAMIISESDVEIEKINTYKTDKKSLLFSQESERKLLLWNWGLGENNIRFTKKGVHRVLEFSNTLAKDYSSQIPLIQGQNIRIKLARISVSFAARVFNTDCNGETLIVDEPHVSCAYVFLCKLYKNVVSGYKLFSQYDKLEQNDDTLKEVSEFFNSYALDKQLLIKTFLSSNVFSVKDIVETVAKYQDVAIELIQLLLKNGCLSKRGGLYVKTSQFTKFLKTSAEKYNVS